MAFRRPPASVVVFGVLVIGTTLWIGSGMLGAPEPVAPAAEERPPITVAVQTLEAEPVERLLRLYGDIEPDRQVMVRAETAGRIGEVVTGVGATVEPGDPLLRLVMGDRQARLRRAQAQLATAEREFQSAAQLVERQIAPETRLQAAEAEREAARAEVEAIELDIDHTTIRAPIEGTVNRLLAELGHYVAVGGEAVEIVDNDPLVAVVQVPQHAIGRVRAGGRARVSLIGRTAVEGTISAIAPLADAETRTFRVEIEIPNPDGALPAGISAEVIIPTETVMAHRVSPAVVTLNDHGEIGVFAVDEDDVVVFHEVRLVRAAADGVWITGPPEQVRLVTARPGFVAPGQTVVAQEEATERAAEDPPAAAIGG